MPLATAQSIPLTRREIRTLTRYYNPAYEGPTDEEIAARFGVSRSAITMRRLRGMAKLKTSPDPAVRRLAESLQRGRRMPRRRQRADSLSVLENI